MFTNTDVHWILTILHSVLTVMYLFAVCSVLVAACLIKTAKLQVGSLSWTIGKGCCIRFSNKKTEYDSLVIYCMRRVSVMLKK